MSLSNKPPQLLRVLVVDDDPIQRRLARALLQERGVGTVLEAADGAEALALLRSMREPIDLTLSDLEMPGMDGVELLSQLGAERPGMNVVLLSSLDHTLIAAVETMAASSGLRVIGGLRKPLSRDRLAGLLDKLAAPVARRIVTADPHPFTVDDLTAAIADHQFIPYLQPKIDLASGRVKGAEALCRWRHPQLGMIPPNRFIPLAEESGLISELTWTMLDQSMALIARWLPQGLRIAVSVNITVSFLEELAVTENITALAAKYRIPPSLVMLEITESMATTDMVAVIGSLVRLRMRGFGLSIDDFGTGYASMQQLSRIPFSELKVDRTFVAGAAQQAHVRAILESSVQLGKRLGLTTIAEGVETLEELQMVRSIGCDIAQGFYFARPMDAEKFVQWTREWGHGAPVLAGVQAQPLAIAGVVAA